MDLLKDEIHLFGERSGQRRAAASIVGWDELDDIPEELVESVKEEVELVCMAGATLDPERFLRGEQTPVYFGSGINNFGVQHFLESFLKLCPPPGARLSNIGLVPGGQAEFSGFVFKIQANLDPKHRDRVAYMRVCSGKFERDMDVTVARSKKRVRVPRALKIFGQERHIVDEAYPGDIIGLVCPGEFRLGDTLCGGEPFHYEPLPQFSPEFFAVLECPDTSRRKQFDRGLTQLVEEGAIQVFYDARAAQREMILASVGELQFDVVRFRLESEYNTPTKINWRPYQLARWFDVTKEERKSLTFPSSVKLVQDQYGHDALLFKSEWDAKALQQDHPKIQFRPFRLTAFEEFAEVK